MGRLRTTIAVAVLGAACAATVGCAEGRDQDGATSFALPSDDMDAANAGTEGEGDDMEPTGGDADDSAQAGGITDGSDPADDGGDPSGDDGAASDGGDPPSSDDGGNPAPPPPPPPPPPPTEPCEGFCIAIEACGVDSFANCAAQECVSEDGGGACDQAWAALHSCVASLPDCPTLFAWLEEPVPNYPCAAQDDAVGSACF